MTNEEININISISKHENKVIMTTSDRNGDLLHTKEIVLQNENNFPIGIGARGIYVENIQTFLNLVNKDSLPKYSVDGIFGLETEKACNKMFGTREISVRQYTMIENFLVSVNKFKKP